MILTDKQKSICEQVINVFETGSTQGNYAVISIYNDGPNGIRQVTYGRAQTTEYGNLEALVEMYVEHNSPFSAELRPYLPKIGVTPLVGDERFKQLLKHAGEHDPVMRATQDVFFDRHYFQPAMNWAENNGFTRALSALVIYDSYIHSGSILPFLRKRFAERPPNKGGDEMAWIAQYVEARHQWLATASNPDLHHTVYRAQCFKDQIAQNNWELAILPVMANGFSVSGG